MILIMKMHILLTPDGYKDVASLLVKDREAFTKFGKSLLKRIKKLHLHQV